MKSMMNIRVILNHTRCRILSSYFQFEPVSVTQLMCDILVTMEPFLIHAMVS